MTARQRWNQYIDMELPEQQLLFRVSMLLSLGVCAFLAFFTWMLRLRPCVPLMLSASC